MFDDPQIQRAYEFAALAHDGQLRKSGEPYIVHPLAVAKTLQEWGLDKTTVMAGLLHDTIEDGGATREDIVKEFSEDVAILVDGVTKISNIRLKGSTQELFVENLRKMLLVMAHDLRVVMVKLADRLHNMQTLGYVKSEKQSRIALETLEIFAPLAERLGMGHIKGQLEDLAFPYVYPEENKQLLKNTQETYFLYQKDVEKFREELLKILLPKLPKLTINVRLKHMYSLFRKLQRPEINNDISKVHDLVAARLMVDTVDECYLALGIIHGKYRPVPYLGMTDYIANPKPNGYKSIHTKVFSKTGRIVEIQIRTWQMHEEAEMGVAAHWQYAQVKSTGVSDEKLQNVQTNGNKLSWVKQLVAWQKEITDSDEYLNALKFDALQHRNLVFSPKGDVYDLPRGATPIDYAYAVHTKLGHQAVGAKVNGKMVGLDQRLMNGDVVEIIIDRKRSKPNRDWLKFVVTTVAKHAIAKFS